MTEVFCFGGLHELFISVLTILEKENAPDFELIEKILKFILNERKKKLFYSYLKTLLIESGCRASEAEEAVSSIEKEEEEGMIRLLSKEWK